MKTSKDFNKERQLTILNAMLEQGYISQEEYDEAVAEELVFNVEGKGRDDSSTKNTVYTWYEDQVIDDVIADLMETYNYSEKYATDMVFSGGLEIYSCMNPDVQAAVDQVYNDGATLTIPPAAARRSSRPLRLWTIPPVKWWPWPAVWARKRSAVV